MSVLFTSHMAGKLQVKNRFIFSACEDGAATDTGMITDSILKRARLVAAGGTGAIISSHMSVHPEGRTRINQTAIHSDETIPGLTQLARTAHEYDTKIIFQLGHAGVQGLSGMGPSGEKAMEDETINEVIESFKKAAGRAAEAGADGVQVHAAHGYLVNEFLSPFYNRREDEWGGSEHNRFRLLARIISGIQTVLPDSMALLVKLNSCDFTPAEGITPPLAARYAEQLAASGIDAIEVSCGTSLSSPWNMCRGQVPVREMLLLFPAEKRPAVQNALESKAGNFTLYEGYNVEAASLIRTVTGSTPVIPVGGWRNLAAMENAVNMGHTEFISLCRPLIREPGLVKKFMEGKTAAASCTSCNRCLAALANNMPVRCYINGF